MWMIKKWMLKNRKVQISAAAGILVLILAFIIFSESEPDDTESAARISAEKHPEGFTFFDIGAHTVFTRAIRENLQEKLGSDVLETKSTIDLTTNYSGFIESYFPELYQLHMKLNDKAGARVEHNIVKSTYRYAQKKDTPFFYVELVFSNGSKRPLFFRINAKKEALGIVDEIRAKYGEPKRTEISDKKGTALYWQKNSDVFVISKKKDRFGYPEFHMMIYFVDNIKELVSIEEKERQQRDEERKKAIEKAF